MLLLNYFKKNDVLQIFLNDGSTQNSLSLAMVEELDQLLSTEHYSGFIVSNCGTTFCAGGNLRFYKSLATKEEGLIINKKIADTLDKIADLPVLKACFINGPCYGGGIEFLSCFDFVVSSPHSLFGLWQRRVGLTFGWGGQKRLQLRLKERDLHNWLLAADTISAYSAKKRGLIDDIQLSSRGLETCDLWIRQSLAFGKESLAEIQMDRDQQDRVFSKLWLSETHKQVLKKF